ncbi:MAG: hypothetical protein JNM17_00630 [Archangium sp.]|nr:hypothetical protein [Archangium sp.]
MKLQWFWNGTYEGLMEAVGAWLKTQPKLTFAHVDIRPHAEQNGTVYWYWTAITAERRVQRGTRSCEGACTRSAGRSRNSWDCLGDGVCPTVALQTVHAHQTH